MLSNRTLLVLCLSSASLLHASQQDKKEAPKFNIPTAQALQVSQSSPASPKKTRTSPRELFRTVLKITTNLPKDPNSHPQPKNLKEIHQQANSNSEKIKAHNGNSAPLNIASVK